MPGTQYTASVWVRAADLRGRGFGHHADHSAGLVLWELGAAGQVVRRHDKIEIMEAGPYQQLARTIAPSANTTHVRFILDSILHCPYMEGHVTYDDCSFSRRVP